MTWERAVLRPLIDSPIESVEVMTRKDKVVYWIWINVWIGVNILLWVWWLQREHITSPIFFLVTTLVLLYETTLLPTFYLFFLGKMRWPKEVKPQSGLRVAMLTAIVPSKESIDVLEKTLEGMVTVTYPHDNWVLDEENDPSVKKLCQKLGVKHFSRKGVPKYNQNCYPFKAKTKAGNYNAWLDAVGYVKYNIIVQLDIDHVPIPSYLEEVLGHFRDPMVAWVQAPSLYGNFEHWTALGSTEQELVLQGPLQMGFYGFCHTPFIIGSHNTLRVKALEEIGGFSETRAEDHLNTVKLASCGYKGVFVPKQIATGMGPENFDTYVSQQFAWAYSMIQILLRYVPKYARKYCPRQRLQFLFVQTWYALWGTTYGVLFLLPILALLFNTPITSIPFLPFIMRYLPVIATSFGVYCWSRKWFQPKGFFLSWRSIVLHIARWPIVLWALINAVFNIKRPYMITPKGVNKGERRPFKLQVHLPYIFSCTAALGASAYFIKTVLRQGSSDAQGYLIFTIQGLTMMLVVYAVALLLDIQALRKEGVNLLRSLALRFKPLFILSLLVTGLVVTSVEAAKPVTMAIAWAPSIEKQETVLLAQMVPQPVTASSQKVMPTPTRKAVEISTSTPNPVETTTSTPTPLTPVPPTPTPVPPTPTPIPPTPTPIPGPLPVISLPEEGVVLGAYDPAGVLLAVPQIGIEHEFISWTSTDSLGETIAQIRSRGHLPLLTIEPFALGVEGLRSDSLFTDIQEGSYDRVILKLAQVISDQAPQSILVRWGHEMEIYGLYPWSRNDPNGYIGAYRHFVDLFREQGVNNVVWIWSPAGNPEAEKYYPGVEYVDLVGITILSDEGWDKLWDFDHTRNFVELMDEKYPLAKKFGKDIIIAEAGVSGTAEHQTEWFQEAFASFEYYPQLWGFVYFNDPNRPNPVTDTYPDWRITAEMLEQALFPETDQTTE